MTAIRKDTPESEMTATADRVDPDAMQWSTISLLLAAVVDEVRISNYLFAKSKSKAGTELPAPEPIARPGVKKAAPKVQLTVAQRMSIDPRARKETNHV